MEATVQDARSKLKLAERLFAAKKRRWEAAQEPPRPAEAPEAVQGVVSHLRGRHRAEYSSAAVRVRRGRRVSWSAPDRLRPGNRCERLEQHGLSSQDPNYVLLFKRRVSFVCLCVCKAKKNERNRSTLPLVSPRRHRFPFETPLSADCPQPHSHTAPHTHRQCHRDRLVAASTDFCSV
jgi:hypothetical protein